MPKRRKLDLPWRHETGKVYDTDNDLIATFEYTLDADAAVLAVNAHDDLVAALAEIYEWTTHKDTPWAERTRFALAKAVKEPT